MLELYRLASLVVLGPLFLYPFSYCPFRLPYLYCFICPVRCGISRARGIALLIILGLNLKSDFFCNHICPCGTMQMLLYKIKTKKISLPYFLQSFKYVSLFLIILVLALTRMPQILAHKLIGLSLGQVVIAKMKILFLGIFLLSAVASIFSWHPFCHNLCPVAALNRTLPRKK
ncbi:MAG: 4Fe-4S binding protein [Candidatus Omnitrophica bacterium]|nr:4Fe-4S binding protein [Candidatus Omnitrophota bacterium]